MREIVRIETPLLRKLQIPNPKKIQITKSQKGLNASFDVEFENCLELGIYFEYEVRDLVVEVRTSVSSARFGFPSASTPLPV